MSKINKIKLSGTTYDIQDLNAPKTVELTQAQYDALVDKDPNTFYVISDAQAGDLSQYWTSAQTNSAITQAVSGKQDTLVSGTSIKTINNESILGGGNIDIQGGGSSYTAGDGIDITNNVISVTGKVDTTTYNTYTAATDTALASKQTTLTAGTNITIVDNVISAEGGSDINVVQTTGTSTTDVMSQSAVTTQLDNKANSTAAVGGYQFGETSNVNNIKFKAVGSGYIGSTIFYPNINGKGILTNNLTWAKNNYNFSLVETSAITTSISSTSTDAQIPSAKAVNDIVGNIETLLSQI